MKHIRPGPRWTGAFEVARTRALAKAERGVAVGAVVVLRTALFLRVGVFDDNLRLTRAFEQAGEWQVFGREVMVDEVLGAVVGLGPAEEDVVGHEVQVVPLLIDVDHHLEPIGPQGTNLEAWIVAVGLAVHELLVEAGLEHGVGFVFHAG